MVTHDFPMVQCQHRRRTNPAKSPFASPRLRDVASKRYKSGYSYDSYASYTKG